jgi:hypothetical protein
MTNPRTLRGTATFTSWEEDPPFDSATEVPRLAHSRVRFAYDGDLRGDAEAQSILRYADDASGPHVGEVVGFEHVEATVDGSPGTFALRSSGAFGPDGVRIQWSVVEGSGTGACRGWRGGGGYQVGNDEKEWTWELVVEG